MNIRWLVVLHEYEQMKKSKYKIAVIKPVTNHASNRLSSSPGGDACFSH